MSHEKSDTYRRKDGRWYNRDTVGSNAGRTLGNPTGYATMEEAVAAAKGRSGAHGYGLLGMTRRRRPRYGTNLAR